MPLKSELDISSESKLEKLQVAPTVRIVRRARLARNATTPMNEANVSGMP
jgi:hypothetical protein